MNQPLSAREAHSLKIRNALISACTELMGHHPIEAITIHNIVEKAGVAKGSFYNHFQDKESLAETVASEIRRESEAAVERGNINVTDPAYKMARGMCYHVQLALMDPARATIMLRGYAGATSSEHPNNRAPREHLREGVEMGRYQPRCEEWGILLIIGSVLATCHRVIDEHLSAEHAINLCVGVFTLVLCGFGVEENEARRIVSESAQDIITGGEAMGPAE